MRPAGSGRCTINSLGRCREVVWSAEGTACGPGRASRTQSEGAGSVSSTTGDGVLTPSSGEAVELALQPGGTMGSPWQSFAVLESVDGGAWTALFETND